MRVRLLGGKACGSICADAACRELSIAAARGAANICGLVFEIMKIRQ